MNNSLSSDDPRPQPEGGEWRQQTRKRTPRHRHGRQTLAAAAHKTTKPRKKTSKIHVLSRYNETS